MVFASQRWLGVRLDCLSALLTGAAAFAAVIVSQDAGKYTSNDIHPKCGARNNILLNC